MHIGKRLARLNAKTVRFDVGSGGTPEFTPADIAAALAFVPAGIGREVLCRVYWPEGAKLTASTLDKLILDLQLKEWTRRETAMYRALCRVATQTEPSPRRGATVQYAEAHKARWPRWVVKQEPLEITETYACIRKAVLAELSEPRPCPDCSASGTLLVHGKDVRCPRCDGFSTLAKGPTWRAERLEMKESSYKQTWAEPYEWLLRLLATELAGAEHDLGQATR